MSTSGGNHDDMGQPRMNQDEVEAALAFGSFSDPELAAVFATLRATAEVPLHEPTAIDQIRRVSEAARLASPSHSAGARFKRRTKRRWAAALSAGVAWKLMVASAALAASGAAAAAGALPDQVQSVVSNAASRFGIEIPNGADQPDLGQSDQGNVSEPEQPDRDHVDHPAVNSDQPQGNADWPEEQSDQPDVELPELDDSDQDSDQVPAGSETGEVNDDQQESDSGQSDGSDNRDGEPNDSSSK